MRITIETLDGQKHDAAVLPVDLIRFERKFDLSLAAMGDSPKMEHLMFLAHSALARAGVADPDFDTWLNTVADFEIEDDDAPLDSSNSSSAPSPPGPA